MEQGKNRAPRSGWGVVALATLALALPSALEAQTGSIRGQVVDAITQRAVGGAQIEIVDTRQGGLTNTSGQYLILNVPVGDHEVRVQFIGFGTVTQTVTVTSGEAAVLDFELAQAALQLDQIVVTGTAQETQARSIGNTVSTIDAADIVDIAPISTVQELLTARTPGLTLMKNSGQAGSSSKLRIRGAGSLAAGLQPVVYVDGIRMKSGTQGGQDVGWGGAQGTDALDLPEPAKTNRWPSRAPPHPPSYGRCGPLVIPDLPRSPDEIDWLNLLRTVQSGHSNPRVLLEMHPAQQSSEPDFYGARACGNQAVGGGSGEAHARASQ